MDMALAKSGCGLLPAECAVRQRRTSALLALPKGEVFCRTQSAGDYQFRAFAEKKNICGNPLRSQNRPCAAPHGPVRVLSRLAPKIATRGRHGRNSGRIPFLWHEACKNARTQTSFICALVAHKIYANSMPMAQNRRTHHKCFCALTPFNLSTSISNDRPPFLRLHRAYSSLRCPTSLAKSQPV